MRYMTEIVAPKDGKGSIGYAYFIDQNGKRRSLGTTNTYREYPSMVRARAAAEAICRAHARQNFPLSTFTLEKA